jgi:hypothetical protein
VSRWRQTPPALRRSVIANLVCDAEENESIATEPAGSAWCEPDEARARARAFRAAIAALRKEARRG